MGGRQRRLYPRQGPLSWQLGILCAVQHSVVELQTFLPGDFLMQSTARGRFWIRSLALGFGRPFTPLLDLILSNCLLC